MNSHRIDDELQAVESLRGLYDQAQKCKQLYEQAQMALPEPLQRFLGINMNGTGTAISVHAAPFIPPPERRNAPKESEADWISISITDASPNCVTLAVLREAGAPVHHGDLTSRVSKLLPKVPSGSITNVGTRLQGKLIDRTKAGWVLLKPELAGILKGERVWGPPDIFGKMEIAAHRREAILHILRNHNTGLQIVQLLEQLLRCPWVHAPINKDLLKADMESLKDKVRRRGNSKKWEIIESGGN